MMINRSLLTKQPSNKTVKRKLSGQTVIHENELKGGNAEKARKVPLKAELLLKLKDLEKEHEALKLENRNQIEINHDLEKKDCKFREKLQEN